MNKNLQSILKFGWHLCAMAMLNKNYNVKNLNKHSQAMMNSVKASSIEDHFKSALKNILDNIQNAATPSVRGRYFGKLNEWLNNVDEYYNSLI